MQVRAATMEDFEPVTRLLHELGGERPPMPQDAGARGVVRAIYGAHLARHREGLAFASVAQDGGDIVGVIIADVRARLNHPTPELWIADLVVTERARGRGIGTALLGSAITFAREVGAHRVSLESGHWRKDAHRFYKREGFADQALHFGLDLTGRQ